MAGPVAALTATAAAAGRRVVLGDGTTYDPPLPTVTALCGPADGLLWAGGPDAAAACRGGRWGRVALHGRVLAMAHGGPEQVWLVTSAGVCYGLRAEQADAACPTLTVKAASQCSAALGFSFGGAILCGPCGWTAVCGTPLGRVHVWGGTTESCSPTTVAPLWSGTVPGSVTCVALAGDQVAFGLVSGGVGLLRSEEAAVLVAPRPRRVWAVVAAEVAVESLTIAAAFDGGTVSLVSFGATPSVLWSRETHAPVALALAVVGGCLRVGCGDGSLHAIALGNPDTSAAPAPCDAPSDSTVRAAAVGDAGCAALTKGGVLSITAQPNEAPRCVALLSREALQGLDVHVAISPQAAFVSVGKKLLAVLTGQGAALTVDCAAPVTCLAPDGMCCSAALADGTVVRASPSGPTLAVATLWRCGAARAPLAALFHAARAAIDVTGALRCVVDGEVGPPLRHWVRHTRLVAVSPLPQSSALRCVFSGGEVLVADGASWEAARGAVVQRAPWAGRGGWRIVASAGPLFAVATATGAALWDVRTGARWPLPGVPTVPAAAALRCDDASAALSWVDAAGAVHAATVETTERSAAPFDATAACALPCGDGPLVAVAHDGGAVSLYTAAGPRWRRCAVGLAHTATVLGVAAGPQGRLVSVGGDATLCVWAAAPLSLRLLRGCTGDGLGSGKHSRGTVPRYLAVACGNCGAGDRPLAAVGSSCGSLALWDIGRSAGPAPATVCAVSSTPVFSVAWVGPRVVAGTGGGSVVVAAVAVDSAGPSLSLQRTVALHRSPVVVPTLLAVPGLDAVVAGSDAGTAHYVALPGHETGPVASRRVCSTALRGLCPNADGSVTAVSHGGAVAVLQPPTLAVQHRARVGVGAVGVVPGGPRVAVVGQGIEEVALH